MAAARRHRRHHRHGARSAIDSADAPAYTIDELAAAAGVPSRTVRHYQWVGALAPPGRKGRIALYREEHLQRLRLIAQLQDRLKLHDAGLHIETGAGAVGLVRHSLRCAAVKLVRHFAKRSGRGFARSPSAGDVGKALTALLSLGAEAVRLVFAQEIERALVVPAGNMATYSSQPQPMRCEGLGQGLRPGLGFSNMLPNLCPAALSRRDSFPAHVPDSGLVGV